MELPRIWDDVSGALAAQGARSIWIGGSYARGEADAYSDIDVVLDAGAGWTPASLGHLWIAGNESRVGENPFFQGVLCDGTMLDIALSSTPWDGCVAVELPEPRFPLPASAPLPGPAVEFWINTLKHRKVLHRGVEAMAIFGLHFERLLLLRMWCLADDGIDPGPGFSTIHGMSKISKRNLNSHRRSLLGIPCRSPEEIRAAIEAYRSEACDVGRLANERFDIPYPVRLEEIVLSLGW